jgi:hypothetical protein
VLTRLQIDRSCCGSAGLTPPHLPSAHNTLCCGHCWQSAVVAHPPPQDNKQHLLPHNQREVKLRRQQQVARIALLGLHQNMPSSSQPLVQLAQRHQRSREIPRASGQQLLNRQFLQQHACLALDPRPLTSASRLTVCVSACVNCLAGRTSAHETQTMNIKATLHLTPNHRHISSEFVLFAVAAVQRCCNCF